MPKLLDKNPMQTHSTMHSFQYSAVDVSTLGASEYTIVGIQQDTSGSVSHFKTDMEKALQQIVEACRKSPRSENLLMRLGEFNDSVGELHGFRELRNIDPSEYDDLLVPRGMTALYDAAVDGAEAIERYGKTLTDMEYACNGILFIVTDGGENHSNLIKSVDTVKDSLGRVIRDESLESFTVVLIGVGDDQIAKDDIEKFRAGAGIDQYVHIGEATPSKLAKLADFISRSISSTSQALGTGQASQPLTF